MEVLIENIVDRLRRLSVPELQQVLTFASFLNWQNSQSASSSNGNSNSEGLDDREAEWQAIVNECSGAWPDFPSAEEIRATMGADIPREEL